MTGAAIIGGIGALASAGSAIYQAKEQKKAAAAAANASQAADHAVASSAQSSAAQQVTTQAEARDATQKAKQRRMSVSSTMNSVQGNGLRATLG